MHIFTEIPLSSIVLLVVLGFIGVFLVWLSFAMDSAEGAMSRVSRASLNNLMIEIQTNEHDSALTRMRKLTRAHRVKRFIVDRYVTSGACTFARTVCNVLIGIVLAAFVGVCQAPMWVLLLVGFFASLLIAIIAMLVRPRLRGVDQPLSKLMRLSYIIAIAVAINPFVHIGSKHMNKRKRTDPSDDEALETIQLDQAKASIDRLVEANDFDPEVSEMMRNVLMLSDTLTREIMVPRTDMICVAHDETLENFLKLCSRSGFSRVPVIGESVDDLLGIAYLKDATRATVFNPVANSREVASIIRDPMFVTELKPVDDLFHEMQRSRQHVAIVVDEYGGIAGLVTIEDALEQIVGELEDEHDRTQRNEPEQVGEHMWRLPARTPIADLEELFEVHIDEDDVDTVYGLLTKILGTVPIVGSSASTRGLKLTAVDSSGRRKKVSTILVEPDTQHFEAIDEWLDDEPAASHTKSANESEHQRVEE